MSEQKPNDQTKRKPVNELRALREEREYKKNLRAWQRLRAFNKKTYGK